MTFITVTLTVLVAALIIGIAVSVIVGIPLLLYIIPYSVWVGCENAEGRHLSMRGTCFKDDLKYATMLYASWIGRKELD